MVGLLTIVLSFFIEVAPTVELDFPMSALNPAAQRSTVLSQEIVKRELAEFWYGFYRKNDLFAKTYHRSLELKPLIEQKLIKRGMPLFLFYVGFIESGFENRAISKMGAVGPWQFMKATAIRYGLRVDDKVDERVDLQKSTHAALNYLEDLYNIFHDWNLAVAAYNAGEFRILEAIRKGKTRNFKELGNLGLLPNETENYLAKLWVVRAMWESYHVGKQDSTSAPRSWNVKIKNSSALNELGLVSVKDGEYVQLIKLEDDSYQIVDQKSGQKRFLKSSEIDKIKSSEKNF